MPTVTEQHGRVMACSLDVARDFNRPHEEILQDIEELRERYKGNFLDVECQDGTPAVMMSQTGFLLLTLDLGGPKEAYHDEFDKVERWVKKHGSSSSLA